VFHNYSTVSIIPEKNKKTRQQLP